VINLRLNEASDGGAYQAPSHFSFPIVVKILGIMFGFFVVSAHAANSPLLELSAQIEAVQAGIPATVVVLAVLAVLRNWEILNLHQIQQRQQHPRRRNISAWLDRLANFAFGFENALLLSKQRRILLSISEMLGLSEAANAAALHTTAHLLGPCNTTCQRCGGRLVQRRKVLSIWILEDDGAHRGQLLPSSCEHCNSTHFPDRHHVRLGEGLHRVYHPNAKFLRIGGKIWASRGLACTMTHLRVIAHMPSLELAEWYNKRFAGSDFKITADHTWQLFVLHESLLLCTERGTPMLIPPGFPAHKIAGLMNNQHFPGDVRVIPGALEHKCDECHHPFRTRLSRDVILGPEGELAGFIDGDDVVRLAPAASCNHNADICVGRVRY
jgi:hypothetical protein